MPRERIVIEGSIHESSEYCVRGVQMSEVKCMCLHGQQ